MASRAKRGVGRYPVGALGADPGVAGITEPRIARDDHVEIVTGVVKTLACGGGAGVPEQECEVAVVARRVTSGLREGDMNDVHYLPRINQAFQRHFASGVIQPKRADYSHLAEGGRVIDWIGRLV